ncbi:MAG TPA: 50S ribosomal protein L6 [Planctomycetota bacterium]|nr:50S ribosomal protein L6 [Planctomycetota bacterium]
MSRLGNKPVALPAGVDVSCQGGTIKVKGPKGEMTLPLKGSISVKVDGQAKVAQVVRSSNARQERAYHGLFRSLLAGMVTGVTQGYSKELQIVGTGYRAAMEGSVLVLNVGLSNPVRFQVPKGLNVTCPSQTQIIIAGVDKQLVGAFAAEVRLTHPPDPYHGKGLRYRDEVVRKLTGKTFGSTAT